MSKAKKLPSEVELQANLIPYMEHRIARERQNKELIETDGNTYFGILSTLEEQLERVKDSSFWKSRDGSVIDVETKRTNLSITNEKVTRYQYQSTKIATQSTPKVTSTKKSTIIRTASDLAAISGTFADEMDLKEEKLKNKSETQKDQKPIIDDNQQVKLTDDEIIKLAEKLHEVHIHWAESLDDIDQRQGWLDFYRVVGAQDRKTNDYWLRKKEAVKKSWVLEMNGLLPHQNGVMPSMEERRRILDENDKTR